MSVSSNKATNGTAAPVKRANKEGTNCVFKIHCVPQLVAEKFKNESRISINTAAATITRIILRYLLFI